MTDKYVDESITISWPGHGDTEHELSVAYRTALANKSLWCKCGMSDALHRLSAKNTLWIVECPNCHKLQRKWTIGSDSD